MFLKWWYVDPEYHVQQLCARMNFFGGMFSALKAALPCVHIRPQTDSCLLLTTDVNISMCMYPSSKWHMSSADFGCEHFHVCISVPKVTVVFCWLPMWTFPSIWQYSVSHSNRGVQFAYEMCRKDYICSLSTAVIGPRRDQCPCMETLLVENVKSN